jgi:uncharacterized membrane protein
LGDAVVAVKDAGGRIKLNQLFQSVARGTVSGMFWGSLIGLLFIIPLDWSVSGALRGRLTDLGISDDFMKRATRTLQSGNAALFLLIRKMTTDKVLAALWCCAARSTKPRRKRCRRRWRALGRQRPRPEVEFPAAAGHCGVR